MATLHRREKTGESQEDVQLPGKIKGLVYLEDTLDHGEEEQNGDGCYRAGPETAMEVGHYGSMARNAG